jgi:hypothetical protein
MVLVNIEVGIVKICDVCESSERPKGAHNVHRIAALPRVGALAWHQRVHCRDQQLDSRLHLRAHRARYSSRRSTTRRCLPSRLTPGELRSLAQGSKAIHHRPFQRSRPRFTSDRSRASRGAKFGMGWWLRFCTLCLRSSRHHDYKRTRFWTSPPGWSTALRLTMSRRPAPKVLARLSIRRMSH